MCIEILDLYAINYMKINVDEASENSSDICNGFSINYKTREKNFSFTNQFNRNNFDWNHLFVYE